MKYKKTIVLLALFYFQLANSEHSQFIEKQIKSIINAPERFENDHINDANRKPEKILTFSNVSKGDRVLDIYAGGGWYTELFSMIVGDEGTVYAHNDRLTWRFGGKELIKRTSNNRLKNVIRYDKLEISELDIAESSVDIAFMAVNYHDLYFTERTRNGNVQVMRDKIVDYRKAFSNIKRMLKDNGTLLIIDHIAKPGSGYEAANLLHRIDPNIVLFELNNLGFELVEEAFYLRNPNDSLDNSVFSPEVRWQTSRFIYKFAKAQ